MGASRAGSELHEPDGRGGVAHLYEAEHLARAFKVEEDEVWKWVDAERSEPTSDITLAS